MNKLFYAIVGARAYIAPPRGEYDVLRGNDVVIFINNVFERFEGSTPALTRFGLRWVWVDDFTEEPNESG